MILELAQPNQNRLGIAILYGVIVWIAVDYFDLRLSSKDTSTGIFAHPLFLRTLAKMWTVTIGGFFGVGLYHFSDLMVLGNLAFSMIVGLGALALVEAATD